MAEFTEHERTELHAKARQQIRFVTRAETIEAASNCRFAALGVIEGLLMAGALSLEQCNALTDELRTTTHGRIFVLMQQTLRDDELPEGVHCTGHVDYDKASRKPEDK